MTRYRRTSKVVVCFAFGLACTACSAVLAQYYPRLDKFPEAVRGEASGVVPGAKRAFQKKYPRYKLLRPSMSPPRVG